MSTEHPRDRLLRDDPALPADLRRAFAAYADITPAEHARAAMLEQIENAAAMPASQPSLRLWRAWWWGGLSVLGLAGLGLLLALGSPDSVRAPLERDHVRAHQGSTAIGERVPAARPVPSAAAASRAEPARVESSLVDPARAASPAAEAPRVVSPAVQSLRRSVASTESRVAERKRAVSPKQSEPLVDPVQELTLLTRAKQVLPRDAQAALTLTDEHATRFPRGTFSEEREVIAIEALLRTGQDRKARERAASFRASYPRSTHLDRLRVVLREP